MTLCEKYIAFKELANLKFASYNLKNEPPENEQFQVSDSIWNFKDYSFYQNIFFAKLLNVRIDFYNLESSFDWVKPKKIDVQPFDQFSYAR